jgi:FtsZ-binding cell division protein ZapB
LDLIQRLRGVRFNWKAGGKEDIGLVAEEVGQFVPEIVTYERNGKDAQSLDYSRLVPVTIEAIKELNERLKAENDTLRKKLEAMSEEIKTLHQTVKRLAAS